LSRHPPCNLNWISSVSNSFLATTTPLSTSHLSRYLRKRPQVSFCSLTNTPSPKVDIRAHHHNSHCSQVPLCPTALRTYLFYPSILSSSRSSASPLPPAPMYSLRVSYPVSNDRSTFANDDDDIVDDPSECGTDLAIVATALQQSSSQSWDSDEGRRSTSCPRYSPTRSRSLQSSPSGLSHRASPDPCDVELPRLTVRRVEALSDTRPSLMTSSETLVCSRFSSTRTTLLGSPYPDGWSPKVIWSPSQVPCLLPSVCEEQPPVEVTCDSDVSMSEVSQPTQPILPIITLRKVTRTEKQRLGLVFVHAEQIMTCQ
jgi:hypothetical protein